MYVSVNYYCWGNLPTKIVCSCGWPQEFRRENFKGDLFSSNVAFVLKKQVAGYHLLTFLCLNMLRFSMDVFQNLHPVAALGRPLVTICQLGDARCYPLSLAFQIPCEDRCLHPQTPPEDAFRGSNYLLTRYLEDFGRLGFDSDCQEKNPLFEIRFIPFFSLELLPNIQFSKDLMICVCVCVQ